MTSYDTKDYDLVVQLSEQAFSEQLAARVEMDGLAGGLGGEIAGGLESTLDIQFDTPYARFNDDGTVTVILPFDNSFVEIELVTQPAIDDFQGRIEITQDVTVRRDDPARHVVLDMNDDPNLDISFADHTRTDLDRGNVVPVDENGDPTGFQDAVDTARFETVLRGLMRERIRAALAQQGAIHLLGDEGQQEPALAVDQRDDAPARALYEVDAGILTTDGGDVLDAFVIVGWLDEEAMPEGYRRRPGEVLTESVVDYEHPGAVIFDASRIVEEFICPNLTEQILGDATPFNQDGPAVRRPCTLAEPTQTTLGDRSVTVERLQAASRDGHFSLSAYVTKETVAYTANVDISGEATVSIVDGEPEINVHMDDPETDVTVKPGVYLAGVVLSAITGGLATAVFPAFNGAFLAAYTAMWGQPLAATVAEETTDDRIEDRFREQSDAMATGDVIGPAAAGMTFIEEPDHSPESLILYGVPETDSGVPVVTDSRNALAHDWIPVREGQAVDLDRNRRRMVGAGSVPQDFDLFWELSGGNGEQDLVCHSGARANASERLRSKPFDAVTLADLQRVNYTPEGTDTTRIDGARFPVLPNPQPARDLLPGRESIDPAGDGYRFGVRTSERQYAVCGVIRSGSQLFLEYKTFGSPEAAVDIAADGEMQWVSERQTELRSWARIDCNDGITVNGTRVGRDRRIRQFQGEVTVGGYTFNPTTLTADTRFLALPAEYEWAIEGRHIDDLGQRTIDGVTVEWSAFGRECTLEADQDELTDALARDDEFTVEVSVEVTDSFGVTERTSETIWLGRVIERGGADESDPYGCLNDVPPMLPEHRYPNDIPDEPVPPVGPGLEGIGALLDAGEVSTDVLASRVSAAYGGSQEAGDRHGESGWATRPIDNSQQSEAFPTIGARREVLLEAVKSGMDVHVDPPRGP